MLDNWLGSHTEGLEIPSSSPVFSLENNFFKIEDKVSLKNLGSVYYCITVQVSVNHGVTVK